MCILTFETAEYKERQAYWKYVESERIEWPPSTDRGIPFQPSNTAFCGIHADCRSLQQIAKLLVTEAQMVTDIANGGPALFNYLLKKYQQFIADHFQYFRVEFSDPKIPPLSQPSSASDENDTFQTKQSIQGSECASFWKIILQVVNLFYSEDLEKKTNARESKEATERFVHRKRLLIRGLLSFKIIFGLTRLPRLLTNDEQSLIKSSGGVAHFCFVELYDTYSTYYLHLMTTCVWKVIKRLQKDFGVSLGMLRNQASEQKHRDDWRTLQRNCPVAETKKGGFAQLPTTQLLLNYLRTPFNQVIYQKELESSELLENTFHYSTSHKACPTKHIFEDGETITLPALQEKDLKSSFLTLTSEAAYLLLCNTPTNLNFKFILTPLQQ